MNVLSAGPPLPTYNDRGFIYIAYSDGWCRKDGNKRKPEVCKIGMSIDPDKRDFQAPAKVHIWKSYPTWNMCADEAEAHRRLQKFRIYGEFFALSYGEAERRLDLWLPQAFANQQHMQGWDYDNPYKDQAVRV